MAQFEGSGEGVGGVVGGGDVGHRPGPVYDTALRRLIEVELAAALAVLGLAHAGAPRPQPASFPSQTLHVDLIARLGPGLLAHIEYERRVRPGLARRMLHYRALIMERYPRDRLTQHVIVLGDGRVHGHDDLAGTGFALDLNVIYLRDLDPAPFLTHPGTAPLAVLARGTRHTRAQVFADAIALINAHGRDRTAQLLEFATLLATIRLTGPAIDTIVQEVGMSVESLTGMTVQGLADFFRDTTSGQALLREGRAEGRAEGQRGVLLALLRSRFGDHDDLAGAADRLATWPDQAAAVAAIMAASTLDELPDASPHTGVT